MANNDDNTKQQDGRSVGKKLGTFVLSVVLTIVAFEATSHLLGANDNKTIAQANIKSETVKPPASGQTTTVAERVVHDTVVIKDESGMGHNSLNAANQVGSVAQPPLNNVRRGAAHPPHQYQRAAPANLTSSYTYEKNYDNNTSPTSEKTIVGNDLPEKGKTAAPVTGTALAATEPNTVPTGEKPSAKTPVPAANSTSQASAPATTNANMAKAGEGKSENASNSVPINPTISRGGTLKLNLANVEVHSKPSVSSSLMETLNSKNKYKIIGQLKNKKTEMILGNPSEDFWYLIITDEKKNTKGWVYGFYVKEISK